MLLNSDTRYGLVARLLHWGIGLLVLGLIAVGFFSASLADDDPLKERLIGVHAPTGVLVLFLSLARLAWYAVSRPPPLPTALLGWEKVLTRIVAIGFLVLLLVQPLLGIIAFDYYDAPVSVFGLFELPAFLAKDMDKVGQFGGLHELVGFVLAGLIALHVAGALKHRYLDKGRDVDVLKRML